MRDAIARTYGLRLRAVAVLRQNPKLKGAWDAFDKNPLLWLLTAAVFTFFLWASVFPLDVASYAQGQVIPAGQLKRIQHLEGGIIKRIAVSEGQTVAAGDLIAELEDTNPEADLGEMSGRAASLEIKVLRLQAYLAGKTHLEIPEALIRDYPAVSSDAMRAFESAKQRLIAMVQTHNSRIDQRRAEIEEYRGRIKGLETRRKFVEDQVRISSGMLKQRLTSEYEHLQLQKEYSSIESDLAAAITGKRKAEVALDEANAALVVFRHEEEVGARKELLDATTEMNSLRERLKKPNDSQGRTFLRAPVDGTIMMLYVKNKGAVVSPGGTVATLVPAGDEFLIEAKLPISEVGYMRQGAPARLTIASGGSGFSPIEAELVHVSPDAVAEEKGSSYYLVRLVPKTLAFHRGKDTYPLRPGLQVTAAIVTGERSVLALLFEPFIGSGVHPLSER